MWVVEVPKFLFAHNTGEFAFRIRSKIVFGFEPFRVRCTRDLKQALCALYSDNRLEGLCSFTKVSDGPHS